MIELTYTFGGPELLREKPQTCAGSKDDAGVYIITETTVRLLLRCPDSVAKAGEDIDPGAFEERMREIVADVLIGAEAAGFVVEMACVQEMEPV